MELVPGLAPKAFAPWPPTLASAMRRSGPWSDTNAPKSDARRAVTPTDSEARRVVAGLHIYPEWSNGDVASTGKEGIKGASTHKTVPCSLRQVTLSRSEGSRSPSQGRPEAETKRQSAHDHEGTGPDEIEVDPGAAQHLDAEFLVDDHREHTGDGEHGTRVQADRGQRREEGGPATGCLVSHVPEVLGVGQGARDALPAHPGK